VTRCLWHRDEGRAHCHRLIERNTTIPQAQRGVHHRRRQPAVGRGDVLQASGRWRCTQDARKFQRSTCRRPPVACPRSQSLRHRRQRHRPRVGQGPGHRQGAVDDHHRPVVARQGRHRAHGEGRRGPRRDDRKRKEEAEVRNNADSLVYQTEKLLKDQGENSKPVTRRRRWRRRWAASRRPWRQPTSRPSRLDRDPPDRQPVLQPAALRGGRQGELAAPGGEVPADEANDDEVVDAEIVDNEG